MRSTQDVFQDNSGGSGVDFRLCSDPIITWQKSLSEKVVLLSISLDPSEYVKQKVSVWC